MQAKVIRLFCLEISMRREYDSSKGTKGKYDKDTKQGVILFFWTRT